MIDRDCPFLRRAKNGQTRWQWVQEANRQCDDQDHRFSDAQHVPVSEQVADWVDFHLDKVTP